MSPYVYFSKSAKVMFELVLARILTSNLDNIVFTICSALPLSDKARSFSSFKNCASDVPSFQSGREKITVSPMMRSIPPIGLVEEVDSVLEVDANNSAKFMLFLSLVCDGLIPKRA